MYGQFELTIHAQNFFWTPTAEYLGRRPVFLVGSLVMFACEIWSAASPNYQNLLASRTIGAFAGSCTEAMGALLVNVSCGFGILLDNSH